MPEQRTLIADRRVQQDDWVLLEEGAERPADAGVIVLWRSGWRPRARMSPHC